MKRGGALHAFLLMVLAYVCFGAMEAQGWMGSHMAHAYKTYWSIAMPLVALLVFHQTGPWELVLFIAFWCTFVLSIKTLNWISIAHSYLSRVSHIFSWVGAMVAIK